MAFRWRVDDVPTLNSGLVAFQGPGPPVSHPLYGSSHEPQTTMVMIRSTMAHPFSDIADLLLDSELKLWCH